MEVKSEQEALFHRFSHLSFWVEVSRRYHRKRAQFLFQFDRFSKFVGVASGSYLIMSALGKDNSLAFGLGLSAALLGLAVLIFRVAERAADHLDAMRSFLQLQNKISRLDPYSVSISELAEIEATKREIEMKSFHEIDALAAVCYNEVSKSLGHNNRVKISWLQNRAAQIGTFQSNLKLGNIGVAA